MDGEAVCIDPYSPEQILDFLHKNYLTLTHIFNTHEHHDHVMGNLELKQKTNAKVFAHPNAREKIPGLDGVIEDGMVVFQSENSTLECLDTPGHTLCHHCFLLKEKGDPKHIFSGDTLFNAGVGNCYRGGDAKTLYRTLKSKLLSLPDTLKIYPGHDYFENNLKFAQELEPAREDLKSFATMIRETHSESTPFVSTLSQEKQINPFFRVTQIFHKNPNRFEKMDALLPKTEENLFLHLRSVRDTW